MSWAWIPNAICVFRILLVGPVVWVLLQGEYSIALVLIAIAGFSDGLDGFLAKRYDWRTRLGSLLDPAADKLLLVSVFLTLTYLGWAPLWLAVTVVLRDAVIVCGAIAYQVLIAPVYGEPRRISKLNTACQLLFVLSIITQQGYGRPPDISVLLLGAGVFYTSVISGIDYILTWSKRAWQAKTTVST
jgi:cardiolipin synthase